MGTAIAAGTRNCRLRAVALCGALAFPASIPRAATPATPGAPDPKPLLIVGDKDYRPLSYLEAGAPKGVDVEISEALARALRRSVTIELMDWDAAQRKVQSGDADLLIDMSVTEDRKALYDFSVPTAEHEFGLFVRRNETQISSVADLAGKRVGVTQGGYPRRFFEGEPGVTLLVVQGYRDGFDRLIAGSLDAFAADQWVGADTIRTHHLSGVAVAGKPFAREPYAMAVRKGNRPVLDEVNRGLLKLSSDGTLERIRDRWRPQEMVFAPRATVWELTALTVVSVLLLLSSGMLIWISSLRRHIALQRRTEAALRESEERLRVAFATFPDAIVWTDPEGLVAYVNEGFTRLTGWRADEVVGKPMPEGFWVDPAQRASLLKAALSGDAVVNLEAQFRRSDGRLLTGLISATAFLVNGRRYVLGISRDITDRKQAEAEREEAVRQLEVLKGRLEEENLYLREEIGVDQGFAGIVGESEVLKYVFLRIQQVSGASTSVLILGETGVGKELVARAIHEASPRARRAFVRVNCGALPPHLAESELFGHEAGAFTGAVRQRKGRFELADGGTIFLDEVGELPHDLQAKLLRILQEGEFERLGSSRTLKVDVRVIAATNRSLKTDVAAGRFREDLFYRLNVFPITVPPLRERREDIPLLVKHFLPQLEARAGKQIREVPSSVLHALMDYSWPGNVRELRNVLERAVLQSSDGVLRLPEALDGTLPPRGAGAATPPPAGVTLQDVERAHIRATLERTRGQISGPGGAAEILGINPNTLRSRMKKLGIDLHRTITSPA